MTGTQPQTIKTPADNKSYPVTDIQKGLLFHSLMGDLPGVYLIQSQLSLQEAVDTKLLQQAWDMIFARHEILRASVESDNILNAKIIIHQKISPVIEQKDFSPYPATEQEKILAELLEKELKNNFDFTKAPLMRLFLIKMAPDKYKHVWVFHHILLAGASVSLITKEIMEIYDALKTERVISLPTQRSYQEYIDYLDTACTADAEIYWKKLLSDFIVPTELNITTKNIHPPKEQRSFTFCSPPSLSQKLKKYARENGLTLNILIQGAWGILLSKYSGSSDIVFGAVRALPADVTKNLAGLFINTLPIRVNADSHIPLISYFNVIKEQHIELRKYVNTSLQKIQQWSSIQKGQPLFNTVVDFKPQSPNAYLKTLGPNWNTREAKFISVTHYPLAIEAYVESDGLLYFKLNYRADVYELPIIEKMALHLENLLASITQTSPQIISDLQVLSNEEITTQLLDWNKTKVPYPKDKTVIQLFEEQAEETPNAIAVAFDDETLTFQTLNEKANQLARYLCKNGAASGAPDVLIGVHVERSINMAISILAVLKTGAAYIPLDSTYPKERINYILNDAKPIILITETKGGGNPDIKIIDIAASENYCHEQKTNLSSKARPNSLVYAIYTSGSTGNPKGVMIEHQSLVNLLYGMQTKLKLKPGDQTLSLTTFSFDIWALEFYLPLITGGACIIGGVEDSKNPEKIKALLDKNKITFMQATPASWSLLINSGWQGDKNLTVTCGGEALAKELAIALYDKVGPYWNVYGPTETTVWSTSHYVATRPDLGKIISIGLPINNTTVYVLDNKNQLLPPGVSGELHIGGDGLARGYLNQPKLTKERFIKNPFSDKPNSRLYKTGDLVRWLPDGSLEFVERNDFQVKIRGFRIELGEIESVLLKHPLISQCAASVRSDGSGDKMLAAYVVPKTDSQLKPAELREFLAKVLPNYMIPSLFCFLPKLPLTTSNKIDRKALSAISISYSSSVINSPKNDVEKEIAAITKNLLQLDNIDVEGNFFEIGAHSLLIMRLCSLLNDKLRVNLQPVDLFTYPSVRLLADYINKAKREKTNVQHIQSRVLDKKKKMRNSRERRNEQAK